MDQFESIIRLCDEEIRLGRTQEAARRISRLDIASIPRQWRLPLARICRRTGLLSVGLRLLIKVVNSKTLNSQASPAELAEYAVLLLRSGAISEALERLESIDADKVPDAHLFKAYTYFARWEYRSAAQELQKYLKANLTPQARLLGATNLAFALVECREHAQALNLVESNIALARELNAKNLELYNQSICGQAYIQEGNFVLAHKALDLDQQMLSDPLKLKLEGNELTNDQFYSLKLKLILSGLELRETKPFDELRRLASARHDWFALREADLFSLKINFDMQRFVHLYFGSPLQGFRDFIDQELGRDLKRTVYVLGPKDSPRFDLREGTLNGKKVVNPGGKSMQILEILLADFYQPLRIAGLHSALYPKEHFNILSSPDRVRQVIRRSRKWLVSVGYPVQIKESRGFYSLVINGNFSFRVSLQRKHADAHEILLLKLSDTFRGEHLFLRKDVCERMGLSVASANRLIKRGMDAGEIERIGPEKRPIGYRFKNTGNGAPEMRKVG